MYGNGNAVAGGSTLAATGLSTWAFGLGVITVVLLLLGVAAIVFNTYRRRGAKP